MGDAGNALDLTGLWNGHYNYPHAQAPVSFTAQLTEADGWLAGSTEEIATQHAYRGRSITATLQGRRAGAQVTFLKLYDEALVGYDTVSYAGVVNQEGTEVAGRWSIPGSWSGTFLMIRATGERAAAQRLATAKV